MINGAHAIIYSTNADADRAFLRDVLKLSHIDSGGGWLIFALPPAEGAVHPGDKNDVHELFFLCDDVNAFAAEMRARGIVCDTVREETWGSVTRLTLPGGGRLGIYQAKHPRPA